MVGVPVLAPTWWLWPVCRLVRFAGVEAVWVPGWEWLLVGLLPWLVALWRVPLELAQLVQQQRVRLAWWVRQQEPVPRRPRVALLGWALPLVSLGQQWVLVAVLMQAWWRRPLLEAS